MAAALPLSGRFGVAPAALPILGDFNVWNALAAAAVPLALGESLADVVDRLASAPQVPGRMERLTDRPCVVLRDYAHTPDALERALGALRPLTRGRLVVVFGCGGDRDRGKRPLMGRVAAELPDLAVVTSDNPRTENPETDLDEIEEGMAARRISDRGSPRGDRAGARGLRRRMTRSCSPARGTRPIRS